MLFFLILNLYLYADTDKTSLKPSSPLAFIENKGQIIDQNNKPNPAVLYLLNTPGFNIQLRKGGFSYDLYCYTSPPAPLLKERGANSTKSSLLLQEKGLRDEVSIEHLPSSIHYHRIDFDLQNANPNPIIETSTPSTEYLNFYTTGTPVEGVTHVQSYASVTYKDIYPGIDLQFIADMDGLFEYNFLINPGADIASIQLKVDGPQKIKTFKERIHLVTSIGDVDETIPVCYYRLNNIRIPVKGRFKKIADHIYGFCVDQTIPDGAVLLIDPIPSRRWGTYYGGPSVEWGPTRPCVDTDGNVTMGGSTESSSNIATAGAYQVTIGGSDDGYIVKFTGNGQRIWGTYFGGTGSDMTNSLSLDQQNNIFIAGWTTSLTGIATPGAFQIVLIGGMDSFVAKFDPSGIRLWSTYFGGDDNIPGGGLDWTTASATDAEGNIYCAGQTGAHDFPVTFGAHQTIIGGLIDAFIMKFTSDGSQVWGTYYGGTGHEQNVGFCISDNTFLYLSGSTDSPNNIATPGSFLPNLGVSPKGFLACFNKDGVRSWGTYFGGEATDKSNGCIADTGSSVYLEGTTNSTTNIATAGTFQTSKIDTNNAYLEKFNSSGNRLWGTYFGAGDGVFGGGAVDDSGFVYLAGTASAQDTLLFTPNAYQTTFRGTFKDAFLVKFSGNGQRIWSTYFGGMNSDWGTSCTTYGSDYIYLTGSTFSENQSDDHGLCTRSPNKNFISTPGSHQREYAGSFDHFLVKFADCSSPDTASQIAGPIYLCQNSTGNVFSIPPILSATQYHWCVIGDLTITSGQNTTSITVDVGSGLGRDTISVYGINSCDTGFPKLITRKVYQRPIPVITGTDTTCTGMGNLFITAGSKMNYQWTVSPGGTILTGGTATDSTCTVSWSIGGAQWIRLNYSDTTGCNALIPAQFNVWVIAGPLVSVNISPSLNPVCDGTSVTYTAIAVNGGSSPVYQWKVNGVNAGTNNSIFTATPVNGDVVRCAVTSNLNCASNNPDTSNAITMVVNPVLPVSVIISPSANTVCAGTSVTFTATPVNGGPSPSYQWKVNGIIAGTNNPVYSYIPNNGDVVTCVLSSNETCTTNNPATSNQVIMVINSNLAVSLSIAASANPSCQGSSVTFTATPTNGGINPSYQWKVNGINVGPNNPVYSYSPNNGDIISCVLSSSESCTSNNPATSNQVIMVIMANLPVGLSISASTNPFCPGHSVTFTVATINGGTTPSYQWKVNGVNVGTNLSTYTYNPVSGDQVSCILTSNLACVTGNPAMSNTVTMSGTLAPIVIFTRCFDSITTTNAKPFKLKGGIPLGGTYSGPGVSNGIFNPAIAGVGTHQITYTYTNAALCAASAVRTIVTVGIVGTNCGQPMTDIRDSRTYQTVQIGNQCWMAEDLNYGTEISANISQRDNCIAEKYHNPASSIQDPVSVYQWDELMNYDETISNQGLCPPGWHIPSEDDWNTLFTNYINNGFAASPLKYSGFSGFNALLSGVRHLNKKWDYQGFATFFWSSTTHGTTKAWAHGMNDPDPSVSAYPSFRNNAFSVRCIRD